MASFTDEAISLTSSLTTVIRLTIIPSEVARLASQWAFVFNVLPINSSLPTQIISIRWFIFYAPFSSVKNGLFTFNLAVNHPKIKAHLLRRTTFFYIPVIFFDKGCVS